MRNCPTFFPAAVELENQRRHWHPDYMDGDHRPILVPGVGCEVCPRTLTFTSPDSGELVQFYLRAKIVGMAPPSELPIKLADAFVILHGEEISYENAAALASR